MSDLIQVAHSAWVAPSAEIYGRVSIGPESSLWPHCVIRAEDHKVQVGRCTNLQDFVMVHIGYSHPTIIGDYVSVTHHATVHGCVIEDECLIGINAVIMDGAHIGRGSIVAPGAVVTEGTTIPEYSIVAGVPAKVIRSRDSTDANRENAVFYRLNADAYRRGEHRVWHGLDTAATIGAELERIRRERGY